MPGSPLSAAEVLRTGLFCGPVETAMRKQEVKSLLPGTGARGAGWAAALSAGWGVRPGTGWEPREDPSQPTQRDGFRKHKRRAQMPKKPSPASRLGSRLVGAGRTAAAAWSFSSKGVSGHKHQRRGTWTNTLTRGEVVEACGV